jgi:glycosyltransferase involved in cell wall biosynthesis
MEQGKRTRVLFFAFGESIHARRRIGIFTADPSFEVGVISTFAYDFENAKNYYLFSSGRATAEIIGMAPVRKIARRILSYLIYPFVHKVDRGITKTDCYCWIADVQLMRDYVRQFKPEVIFLQTLMYPCYLSFLVPNKIPSIITFWNGDLTWWAKWNGIERAFKKQIVLHGIKRAAAITVNSEAALTACLGYGSTQGKTKLIRYPGVNLDIFKPHPLRSAGHEKLALHSGKIVLCPRGLSIYLNNDVIIEAAAGVVKQFPDTVFIFLAGPGLEDVWKEHMRRADELGIASNIRRDLNVKWETMPLYYNAADVMVSISSNDSLPNCMLEAMACGVPVVMGDILPIREWVKDGENGFLVPPLNPVLLAQRIIEILADQDGIAAKFVQKNIEIVHREVDSRVVVGTVKNLVRDVALRGSSSS